MNCCSALSCILEDASKKLLTQVLRSTDLRVQRGTLHILAGANGCGKSTLLRIVGGLLPKQRGDVTVGGTVGMVLQNPDHQIVMPTVAAEVAFGLGRWLPLILRKKTKAQQMLGIVSHLVVQKLYSHWRGIAEQKEYSCLLPPRFIVQHQCCYESRLLARHVCCQRGTAFGIQVHELMILCRFKLSKQTVKRLVESALQAVDLGGYGERPTNSLSGGEKQRVAIAGALVTAPKVCRLDA